MNHALKQLAWILASLAICSGCRSGSDKEDGEEGNGQVPDPGDIDLDAECPSRLDPVSPFGLEETVGDGTAESCSESALRAALEAIRGADGGGSIAFDCGGEHTIELTESLFVDTALLVDGEGGITLSGGGVTRVFELDHYAALTVQRLTIADGLTEESGAGIYHPWYGTLAAIEVTFDNNRCTSQQGEIGGGAVFAGGLGEATFSDCRFIGNSASNGGGILNRGSNLVVVGSTFYGNEATSSAESGQFGNGGGLYIDGMVYADDGEPADFFMCGTIFESNRATQHGSAVFSYFYEGTASYIDQCHFSGNHFDSSPTGGAGGLYHEGAPLRLTNSTFNDNRSDKHAAGLFVGSGSAAVVMSCTFTSNIVPEVGAAVFSGSSPVEITNCTFHANDADYAPTIFKGEAASITLKNTLFSSNTSPNQYSALSCHETFVDGGGNLQWPDKRPNGNDDTPCTEGIVFADPMLGPFTDNGGAAPTMMPDTGSPAIDAASDCPETDQAGLPRNGACDIGAVEVQP